MARSRANPCVALLPAALAALSPGCACAGEPGWKEAAPGLDAASWEAARGAEVWALRFSREQHRLDLVWAAAGLRLPADVPGPYLAAVNGGYFERDFVPSGVVVVDGRRVSRSSGGSGAIDLTGGRLSILPWRDLVVGPRTTALQAWPFVIDPDGGDGIRSDDGKHARRTVLGLDAAGRGLILVVARGTLSLRETMGECRRAGAVVAVNLDGGPSTGLSLTVGPRWRADPLTPVSSVLVLRAR